MATKKATKKATKNPLKGGAIKTKKTVQSAAKAAAKGGANATSATSKGSVKAASKKSDQDKTKPTSRRVVHGMPVVEAKIELGPLSSSDYSDEPPPSLSTPPIRGLAWGYSLINEFSSAAMANVIVEAGTKVAIEGELDRLAYVYVLQIGIDDGDVEVLYPPASGARRMRPGARIRIPAGTGWVVTTKKARLRTVASTYPLTDDQIAAFG